MANWSNPTITTQYDVFVSETKARDVDAITMILDGSISSPPVGSIKMVRLGAGQYKLQEWAGAGTFDERYLSVAGGGTGTGDPATARINLGIGSMGVQASNAVAISGGTIYQLSGFSVSCSILFTAGSAYDLGSNAAKVRRGYFSDAIVLPVGVDKYATS